LITTYARETLAALRTYTISFPEMPEIDESPLAEWNASALGTLHRTVPVTVAGLLGTIDHLLDVTGEPAGDAAALPLAMLADEVAGDVKVVLTGEGADEMFGGYRRYDVSRYLDGRLVGAVGVVTSPVADVIYRHRSDRPRGRAVEALLRGGARGYASLLGSDLPTLERSCPEGHEVARLFLSDWYASAGSTRGREAARRFDLARWLPNTYLEKTDRATMAAGVEARTPFLDPAVAASLGDPALQFGKDGLRRLLCERLPVVRLPARKKGLAVPVSRLLAAGLNEDLRRCVESSDSLITKVLGQQCTEQLANRAQRSMRTAYRLAVLSRWHARMDLVG
jgi:asparagine synthase (glutamine-hydrolysing)